jgi:hypothetical protein
MRRTSNTATISRMGADSVEVEFENDESSLREVLAMADIELSSTETAWVNGESANALDKIEDGDTIQIVGKKEGGLK